MDKRKALPISFMPAMVRAERAGLKTHTRRVANIPAGWQLDTYLAAKPGYPILGRITSAHPKRGRLGFFIERRSDDFRETDIVPCPYGAPGDLLYVKEAAWMWCERIPNGTTPTGRAKYRYEPLRAAPIHYVADHPERPTVDVVSPDTGNQFGWRYKVARFLPRWASRATLKITDVRVERLQEISEADATAEGAEPYDVADLSASEVALLDAPLMERDSPNRNGFALLWVSINGAGSWAKNPWVWVVKFTAHPINVDRFLEDH